MEQDRYPVHDDWKNRGHIDLATYTAMYKASVEDPDGFWAEQAKCIDWIKPFTIVKNTTFGPPEVSIKWFEDGTTNLAMNCIV